MHPQTSSRRLPILKVAALLLLAFGVGETSRILHAEPIQPPAEKPLAAFLPGTKWLWYGSQNDEVEFRKGGEFELADWARQGLAAVWEVTGPNEVK
jgi:hypothetical protein